MMKVVSCEIENLINQTLEELKKLFNIKLNSVFLFGSYARGDFDEYSDIDFMALVDTNLNEINSFNESIANIENKLSIANENCITISITVQQTERFIKYKDALPFYANIEKEGVRLYVA